MNLFDASRVEELTRSAADTLYNLGDGKGQENDLTREEAEKYARAIFQMLNAGGISLVSSIEIKPNLWSKEDRRNAREEGNRRWKVRMQRDRVLDRDHDLYNAGAINGFILGAEWWNSNHITEHPPEPSDTAYLAIYDVLREEYISMNTTYLRMLTNTILNALLSSGSLQ